jgi:hypothetical protein
MYTKSGERHFPQFSPLSLLEEFFFQLDWSYSYINDTELTAEIPGRWCVYSLFASWKEETESLMISASIDMKIPNNKRQFIDTLLSSINPRLWFGHFEVAPEVECLSFRYNLILRGSPSATLEQVEEIVMAAVTECDRLYPALQFVLWGGKTPEEALMAAMMETHGEA